jgi:uncharacterized membrane protein (DUF485 family)
MFDRYGSRFVSDPIEVGNTPEQPYPPEHRDQRVTFNRAMTQTTRENWDALARSPRFKALLQEKRRFIVPATVFFLVYYFALPILVGYFPEFMKRQVIGPVNIAYLFALSQFGMAWALAWIYMRAAVRFDSLAEQIRTEGELASR